MQAQCELKAAGLPYPRTCPVCRLGPCQRRESRVFANAQVYFEGRRNGMNELDERGEYVALTISPDNGQPTQWIKMSVAQAEALGRDFFAAHEPQEGTDMRPGDVTWNAVLDREAEAAAEIERLTAENDALREALDAANAALSILRPAPDSPINWRDDPDATVEDDEPMIGRDYA